MNSELLMNLDKIHTTELGAERILKNLSLQVPDVVAWCKETIERSDRIIREGKNWYVYAGNAVITINAHSYTIITAHPKGKGEAKKVKSIGQEVPAPEFTRAELEEAREAIASTIRKCEKAQENLMQRNPPPTSQLTLLHRRLNALRLSMALILRELDKL